MLFLFSISIIENHTMYALGSIEFRHTHIHKENVVVPSLKWSFFCWLSHFYSIYIHILITHSSSTFGMHSYFFFSSCFCFVLFSLWFHIHRTILFHSFFSDSGFMHTLNDKLNIYIGYE